MSGINNKTLILPINLTILKITWRVVFCFLENSKKLEISNSFTHLFNEYL